MKVSTTRAFSSPICEQCEHPPRPSLWGTAAPGLGLLAASLPGVLLVAVPLLYLTLRALQGGTASWVWLLSHRIPGLMARSMQLAVGATVLALILGVPLAWLVVRTDLPGRRWLSWVAALPLAFPPYVGAFAYLTVFGPRGLLEDWLSRITGVPGHLLALPDLQSVWGAALILGLFTFPYIYMMVASALKGGGQSLEEAARSSGLGPWQVFWRVTLPLLRPALVAGGLLVALYALSDFGAVAMLRVESFTSSIYLQLRGRFDRSAAAALSLVLTVLTLGLLWLQERIQRQGGRYHQTGGQWRPAVPIPLGRWKIPAMFFVGVVVLASVGMPAGMLAYWSLQGIREGVFSLNVAPYLWNTAVGAGGAALLVTVLAFPLAYLASRHDSPATRGLYRLAYTGYALPGVVVALAVIFLFHRFANPLYGTVWALVTAYVIRFLPQSLGATYSGLETVPPSLEDAGRGLGLGNWGVIRRVTLPLIARSLVTGGALVFLNTLKELPATLLLRPAGWDTLAVRIWMEAEEGFFVNAAPPALTLVLLATVPLSLVLRRMLRGEATLIE